MNTQDLIAIAREIGWPLAIALFIGWVLAKNGWIKVIMRDERKDEIEALKTDVEELKAETLRLRQENDNLWKQDAVKSRAVASLKTDVAVLMDRWNHRKG